jgi:hypothetical protein
VPLSFHRLYLSFLNLLVPCLSPLLFYLSVTGRFPSGFDLMILFFWFPTFICCATQPQRPPWTPMRTHSRVAISAHLCHSLYDPHCHGTAKAANVLMIIPPTPSHHFHVDAPSTPPMSLCSLRIHFSQLPGALGLSLERMFYSPQKTAASTMRNVRRHRLLSTATKIYVPPCQV